MLMNSTMVLLSTGIHNIASTVIESFLLITSKNNPKLFTDIPHFIFLRKASKLPPAYIRYDYLLYLYVSYDLKSQEGAYLRK